MITEMRQHTWNWKHTRNVTQLDCELKNFPNLQSEREYSKLKRHLSLKAYLLITACVTVKQLWSQRIGSGAAKASDEPAARLPGNEFETAAPIVS
jgi:hypothetical protein